MVHAKSIALIAERSAHIRDRFGVADLRVGGSVARGESTAGSDIDVLVTFADRPTFDRFMDLKAYLEELLARAWTSSRVPRSVPNYGQRSNARPFVSREVGILHPPPGRLTCSVYIPTITLTISR